MRKKINEANSKKRNNEEGRASSSSEDRIITDPFGSWTGVVLNDSHETPVQDVDDL